MPGSIVSMMNCAPVYYCSDDLDLDINKDGIIDFKIVSGGGGGLGGGSSSTIIESLNPDNFVSTFPDSSYWNPFAYVVVNTAIAYSPGDSISSLLRFTNSSPLYYNSNTSYIFASHYGNFASPSVAYWNGIGEHFIAVKLIVQNSALFGWIRVQVDNSGQITIKDYACNFTIPKEVLLFPNPANEELHIRFTNSESQTITIYNEQGAIVKTINISPDGYEYILNTISMSQGIYILKIRNSKETVTKRFVVKHNHR